MTKAESSAFVAGGTVQAGGGIYLPRRADDELLEHCLAGNFTYILTSRQMGKSSLMVRTAERLVGCGVQPVVIDLTEFGAQTTAEQWYKGFLLGVQIDAGLRTPAAEWWAQQVDHSYAHKFTRYFREVVLKERSERLVILVDEIDTTLRLDFTDDFFAAIRFLYQQRAAEPALQRLSFVLIGVATPGDLIKDTTRTPFNIGHRIDLTDFTLDEASVLAHHLAVPEPTGRDLIQWILNWTNGHPYLTLRAIRSLADAPPETWTASLIDERIGQLFLHGGADSDSNLQFVRDMLTKKAFNREAVLRTYWNIRRGVEVPDKELDQVDNWLKLSGVVQRQNGLLRVRNPIYERVFDEGWAHDHLRLHVNWRRRLTKVAGILLILTVVLTIPLAFYAWRQKEEAEFQALEAAAQRDDAVRRGQIAEESFNKRARDLETTEKLAEKVKPSNPKVAEEIGALVAEAKQEVQQDRATLAAPDRKGTDPSARNIPGRAGARPERPAKPADPPAPAPPPLGEEEQAVMRVLDAYRAAYAARDIKALQGVQVLPPALQKSVASEFTNPRYQMQIEKVSINVASGARTAVVHAGVTRTVVDLNGRLRTATNVERFLLEKRRGRWMIVSPPLLLF
jgi:AAA-like domain